MNSDDFSNSKTYRDILEHRKNCSKWCNEFCLDCFGGGLTLTFDKFLNEDAVHLTEETQEILNDKEAMKSINAHKILLGDYSDYISVEKLKDTSSKGCGKISAGDEVCGEDYICYECKELQESNHNSNFASLQRIKQGEEETRGAPSVDDTTSKTSTLRGCGASLEDGWLTCGDMECGRLRLCKECQERHKSEEVKE